MQKNSEEVGTDVKKWHIYFLIRNKYKKCLFSENIHPDLLEIYLRSGENVAQKKNSGN